MEYWIYFTRRRLVDGTFSYDQAGIHRDSCPSCHPSNAGINFEWRGRSKSHGYRSKNDAIFVAKSEGLIWDTDVNKSDIFLCGRCIV